MIVATTRILTAWLRDHPQYGVNAMLADMPIMEGDRRPNLFELQAFVNDVDNEDLATKYEPNTPRSIAVVLDQDPTTKVERKRGMVQARMGFAVSFLLRDPPSVVLARQEAEYVLDAIFDSLMFLQEPSLSDVEVWRKRLQVKFLKLEDVSVFRTTGMVQIPSLMGTVLGTVSVMRYTPV